MVEVVILNPDDPMPRDTGDHVTIVTQYSTKDSSKVVTDINSQYQSGPKEATFGHHPYGTEVSFEDALEWAKKFAEDRGIPKIYAVDRTRK